MQKTQLINIARRKLSIRNYSPRTINSYISAIRHFSDWLLQNQLKTITNDSLEQYLYHLKQREHHSISSMRQVVATTQSC
ncbi:MAG: phage integrase N-terminal SAM-like domain-containing protein [Candidatus Marinimicrobia bacterium]|nr:phage integrase N-terminal SAM-like domain-containing protein [Candidatus Neomarinimicrobiota bacterium]